jgi:hypothetical protein
MAAEHSHEDSGGTVGIEHVLYLTSFLPRGFSRIGYLTRNHGTAGPIRLRQVGFRVGQSEEVIFRGSIV